MRHYLCGRRATGAPAGAALCVFQASLVALLVAASRFLLPGAAAGLGARSAAVLLTVIAVATDQHRCAAASAGEESGGEIWHAYLGCAEAALDGSRPRCNNDAAPGCCRSV